MLFTRRRLLGGVTIAAFAAAAGIFGAVTVTRAQGPSPAPIKTGQKAPSFTVTTLKGETLNPTTQTGKVVIIDFWATWCPPCRASIPHLQELQRKYSSKGLMIVGISPEEKSAVVPFAAENKMTYTLSASEDNNKILARYGVEGIPTMVILDRKGKVRLYEVGFNPNAVSKTVKKLVAEN